MGLVTGDRQLMAEGSVQLFSKSCRQLVRLAFWKAVRVSSYLSKDRIQCTNFFASASLISTAFGSIATPLDLCFQCRSWGLGPEPCRTVRVRRSTASRWPLYFFARSFHAGPVGSNSSAPGFLGSILWQRLQPLSLTSFIISLSSCTDAIADCPFAKIVTSKIAKPMRDIFITFGLETTE
jgi:hypothetical protein